MPIRAKVQGRDIVMRRLNGLAPNASAAVAVAIETGVKELAAQIQQRAPVRTGKYRDSIQAVRMADRNGRDKPIGIQLTKDPNAWGIVANYIWRFLEFGTKAHAAEPSRRNMNYKRAVVMTRSYAAHAATPAFPHIFNTYRAMRKRIRRRIATAINKALKNR